MSRLLINEYLAKIDRLRRYSGTSTEKVVSEAFKDLLKRWSRQAGLHFVPHHDYDTALKTRVTPDGAVLHDLRVPLGWWEANDTADDLAMCQGLVGLVVEPTFPPGGGEAYLGVDLAFDPRCDLDTDGDIDEADLAAIPVP